MKILIQRVLSASVHVSNKLISSIGPGALVFLGVTHDDSLQEVKWLANKLATLRFLSNSEGKINASLLDQNKPVLVVSQFTLYGNCSQGRRPSFTEAAKPQLAEKHYRAFIEELRHLNLSVETGEFGANMQVSLINDGPVTLSIEKLNSIPRK